MSALIKTQHVATPFFYRYDDGGRSAAGLGDPQNDCVTRAISIASGVPYAEVYDALNRYAQLERRKDRSSSENGVHRETYDRFLLGDLGAVWTPLKRVGDREVHRMWELLFRSEPLVVTMQCHLTAVVGGVIRDTYDPSDRGWKAVYGYYALKKRS